MKCLEDIFVVVQSLSDVQLFATPRTAALLASLSFTISQSLLKLMSIESVMPFKHLILCCPLLLPSVFPSIRVFSNESVLGIRKPAGASVQYRSFQWKGIQIIQFSHSVVSDSLWPHGLQHARLPRPSPTPRAYSNSWSSSQWCHPTISSSAVPFSCLQSFPASGSFPMNQFFASGGQSIIHWKDWCWSSQWILRTDFL